MMIDGPQAGEIMCKQSRAAMIYTARRTTLCMYFLAVCRPKVWMDFDANKEAYSLGSVSSSKKLSRN